MNRQTTAPFTGVSTVQPVPSPDLVHSFARLFRDFRRTDLAAFRAEHDRLYAEAQQTGDYLDVTTHYYRMLEPLIAMHFGENWHFCPPGHPGEPRAEATARFHRLIAELLELQEGTVALDVGCGVGGTLRALARETGARFQGITLGDNEVATANRLAAEEGLGERCLVVQGDSQEMPFGDNTFNGAYAVYALKYYPSLERVLSEIHRVLRPGGRFVAYCLCKSETYDPNEPVHRQILRDFEYATAMPALHTVQGMVDEAAAAGLQCIARDDLSRDGLPWYDLFVRNPLLPWLVSSRAVYQLTRAAEVVGALPTGFAAFNDTFLSGTVRHLIDGGRSGILTGSALLVFQKKA